MNKLKLFIENFLIYGLGGIISKAIPLIMIPLITLIMPSTSYFGISDLSDTIISFGTAIAIMGMADAMYRMFFEKEDTKYKQTVCSTTLIYTMITSVITTVLMIIFRAPIAELFFKDGRYSYVVIFSATATLVSSTTSILSAPTRMQNKRKIFLVTNTIAPLLSYGIAIPLLLNGYYIIALPLATVISAFVMGVIFFTLNHSWFRVSLFDKKLLKQMLAIALPLLPNFLIYWVFNSCDKVMITNFMGADATGVYSVGSKLGHASQLIYTAFAGGWQYFSFATMNEEDQVGSNSRIFEYLGAISFAATAFVCAFSYPLFGLLFEDEYLAGYIVAPYLFLAPLLQMLFQVGANQFLVVKKTWPNLLILSTGAGLNFVINLFLIPALGIEGAALATLAGYTVSNIACVIVLCRMKLMVMSARFIVASVIMAAFMTAWRLLFSDRTLIGVVAALALSGCMVFLYRRDIKSLIEKIKNRKSD